MASLDNLQIRFIDELLGSASMLDEVESAAIAEAWASGAIAEWAAIGGVRGGLAKLVVGESTLAAELISWLELGTVPQGDADWVADVGRHEVIGAAQLTQQARSGEIGLILEYVAPSGDRHDLSATLFEGTLAGLVIGPEGLADAAREDKRDGLSVEHIDPQVAIDLIRTAAEEGMGELSEAAEATLPLLLSRLGMSDEHFVDAPVIDRALPERDLDDDRYAVRVLTSALREVFAEPMPTAVEAVMRSFRARVATRDPDVLTLFGVAGIDTSIELSPHVFLKLVGAYLAPIDLGAHTDAQFAALIDLESADWLGVILGMSRAPVGTDVDGDVLVTFINRAPEVTTTIPKGDVAVIAWTFEQMLFGWQVTGVLDDAGAVSDVARWLLPHAARAVWAPT
ncbi:MAG: hypothetical protein ACI81L_000671 [Verrucomicrobiales bacterium]|jgi:hypothetical protein